MKGAKVCPICLSVIEQVRAIACDSCDVTVLDMADPKVALQAKNLGVMSVPAIAIDNILADCCAGRDPDEKALRAAGLGQSRQ